MTTETVALGCGYGDQVGTGYIIHGMVRVDNIWCKVLSNKRGIAKVQVWPTQEIAYIVAYNGYQAHGKTPQDAAEAAKQKWEASRSVEERLEFVRQQFAEAPDNRLSGHELYKIHGMLTGSCAFGRDNFVKTHGVNLDKKYSLKEFVDLVGADYGGQTVKRLLEK